MVISECWPDTPPSPERTYARGWREKGWLQGLGSSQDERVVHLLFPAVPRAERLESQVTTTVWRWKNPDPARQWQARPGRGLPASDAKKL